MEKRPFFTIGIPIYNMAKWVGECLDSILSQEFTDYEIICVDDGSLDNSLEVLNDYAKRDSRIKIIPRKNGGVSSARNCIFCYAKGQYIYTIDSDDTMCKGILFEIYKTITDNNYPDIVQTGHLEFSNGEITEFLRPYPGDEYFSKDFTKDERAIRLWADRTFKPFGSTRFLKTSFVQENGLMFSLRYSYLEDSAFCFDIYRKADSIVYYNKPSFIYQRSREPVSNRHSMYKIMYGSLTRWEDFYNDVTFWNVSYECRQIISDVRHTYLIEFRHHLLTIFETASNKDDAFKSIAVADKFIGKDLKKLPLPKGQSGLICLLFRIIGIMPTMKLLYRYMHLRGIAEI